MPMSHQQTYLTDTASFCFGRLASGVSRMRGQWGCFCCFVQCITHNEWQCARLIISSGIAVVAVTSLFVLLTNCISFLVLVPGQDRVQILHWWKSSLSQPRGCQLLLPPLLQLVPSLHHVGQGGEELSLSLSLSSNDGC